MSLGSILDRIKAEKDVAEQDINQISPRALPYKKGQIRSAKERLEGLYIDYKNEMLKRAIFILVTGNKSELFAEIAEKDFKCFKVDGKEFFKEIVNELHPEIYEGKKMNASVFDIVGNVLEDKMKRLDIMSYDSLRFTTDYSRVVKNKNEMVNLVKDAVVNIVGGEVVALDALEKVAARAVNDNYKSKLVPILIHTNDENFVTSVSDNFRVLTPKVVRVSAGDVKTDINPISSIEEITKETVEEALKKIATNA